MGFELNIDRFMSVTPCQCCAVNYTASTHTYSTRKWTKEEVEQRIILLARKLAEARFWERGEIRRDIQHWTKKLTKIEEVLEEFKIK